MSKWQGPKDYIARIVLPRRLLLLLGAAFVLPALLAPGAGVASSHVEAQVFSDEIDWDDVYAFEPNPAFGMLGFNDAEQRLFPYLGFDAMDAAAYRYGDSTSDPPTIDLPGTRVEYLSAAYVQLPDDIVANWPVNGDIQDGALYLRTGQGPITGQMTLFAGRFQGPVMVEDMTYFVNMGFVTSYPDSPAWESDFDGDNWWGGFRMPTIEYGPSPWSLGVYEYEPPQNFGYPEMDGFGLIYDNTMIVGIDSADLAAGGYDISTIRFGLHLHVSDDLYGSSPESASVVTSYPFPTGRTYDDLLPIPLLDTLVAGSTVPLPESTTTTEPATAADDATTLGDNAVVTPAEDDTTTEAVTSIPESGGSTWPWVLIAAGLALIAGGGFTYASGRRQAATATGPADDAGALFVSGVLQLGTGDKTTLDAKWRALTRSEDSLQRRLKNQWLKARKDLAQAFGEYEKAMGVFKENAINVMSATTVFDKLITQGTKTVATMKTVDFVWGVGQLGLAGVRAAIARWFKAPPNVPWGAADDVAEAGAAAVRGPPPGFMTQAGEAAKAIDQKILAKLAEEAGVDLVTFMSRFANAEEAGRALVSAVAQVRGWVPLADDAQALIRRLLDAGTSAIGSPSSRIDPADLAQLLKWADEVPDFWTKLGKAADWFETGGWYREIPINFKLRGPFGARITETLELLFRADDVSFLRNLVDRARKGWKPPTVPDEFTGMPANFPLPRGWLPRQNIPGTPPAVPTSTPTVLSRPATSGAPTVLSAPGSGAPTVLSGSWSSAPTVLGGSRAGFPSVPTVLDGPGMPSLTGAPTPSVVQSLPGWGGAPSGLTTPGNGWQSGVDAFHTIMGGTGTASWLANPASDAPLTLAGYARYHGIDPDLHWAANPPGPDGHIIGSLMTVVGRKAGWHQLPVDVGMLCDDVLEEAKIAIGSGSGGILDGERLGNLKDLCGAEDFPNWLSTAYVNLPEAVVFPYCGDDAVFLETLCNVAGDYTACGEALGPVWETAITTTCDQMNTPGAGSPFAGSFPAAPPNTVVANPLFQPVTEKARAKYEQKVVSAYRNSTTSAYIGLEQVPLMFGNLDEKTSEFHFAFWTFENSVLATGWQVLASPFETMGAAFYSGTAYQELGNLLTTHGTQLDNMSSSFRDAGRAIDKIRGVLDGVAAADGLVGGLAETKLEDILQGYQDLFDSAPIAWQQDHKAEFGRRKAHIRQKQYQLVRALRPIRTALANLPKLKTWLNSLRRKDGSQLDLVNPEVWVRLGAVAMQMNGMIAEAFLSGARQPQPPPRRVPPKQEFDWDKMAEDLEEMERKKKTMPKAEWEALYIKKYGMPPMDW